MIRTFLSDQRKKELRRAVLLARPRGTPGENRRLIARLLQQIHHSRPVTVGAVWPLPGEVDLRPLCRQLVRAGYQVALPQTPAGGQPLVFRCWQEGMALRQGRFGTSYPAGPRREPDLILVPLLAFDRQGGRLGYGGGYYDRTLPLRPDAMFIGYGLAAQEREGIPMDEHDQRLPVIVTECETIICETEEKVGH